MLFRIKKNISLNMTTTIKKNQRLLNIFYNEDPKCLEIGVDEAGRGPMFGRVYAAAVILPKDNSFEHFKMKDSKKFHSKKKLKETSDYIKNNALWWDIQWENEKIIDDINIRNATFSAMHKAILNIYDVSAQSLILVDGNDFKPLTVIKDDNLEQVSHVCIEGGDNKYSSIAAASILAKVARDEYIETICDIYPYLNERYDLLNNKGYGTKKHLDGINKYGITEWHRKTFGICKNFA